MRRARYVQGFQPVITSDPVVDMHHQVAGGDLRNIGDEILGPAAFFLRPHDPFTENVLFGYQEQVFSRKSAFDGQDGQGNLFRWKSPDLFPVLNRLQPNYLGLRQKLA